jgi:DNA processing protein
MRIERLSVSSHLPLLAQISAPPREIFYLVDAGVLTREAVTVVGTRRPTAEGLRAAFRFGRDLAAAGLVVVSGLARGVDTKAHEGALCAGGITVAVLAHGLDRIYPPENGELAQRITEQGGCLVTEYPSGTPPHRRHFPARNRILAGLSRATVVVEAGEKSGSLITAGFALDQGREVFVVPGSFDAPSFSGSHRLISDGAALVSMPSELLGSAPRSRSGGAELSRWFGPEGVATLGELFAASRLALADLEAFLLEAEREGRITRVGAQRYLYIG